jgi:hypothetical protein
MAASEPQVLGSSVKAFIAGVSGNAGPMLAKYGFDGEIDEQAWYSQEKYAAMMTELADSSFITDMVSIGLQISRHVPLPPQINSVESILALLNDAYHMNHRQLPPGEGWEYRQIDHKTHYVISRNPYPENFSYGVVYGFVERFAPKGSHFSVYMERSEDGCPAYRIALD